MKGKKSPINENGQAIEVEKLEKFKKTGSATFFVMLCASISTIAALIAKDLAAERRTREQFSAMLIFALIALLSFGFALDLQGPGARVAAPGILWTTLFFSGTLGLNRSLAREEQSGGLDALRLLPVDSSVIFFGKAVANWILMTAVEALLLPLCGILFDVWLLRPEILAVLALGTWGYATVGTLLAAMAVNSRAREVLLPILLLPLVIPLLIAAVQATGTLVAGGDWNAVAGWVNLLLAYDLIVGAVALLTFDFLITE
jgi:heme exporter protein B